MLQKRTPGLAIPHAVLNERDPTRVRELYHLVCEKITDICLKAADLLEEAEVDPLGLPELSHPSPTPAHQQRAGAVNRKLKRRSHGVETSRQEGLWCGRWHRALGYGRGPGGQETAHRELHLAGIIASEGRGAGSRP